MKDQPDTGRRLIDAMKNGQEQSPRRRDFLRSSLAVTAGAAMASSSGFVTTTAQAQTPIQSKARILVLGAGAAGLACIARLSKALDGADITVIDKRQDHYYQPGYTLIASGIKPAGYVVSRTSDYIPEGVRWLNDSAVAIDPEARTVETGSGQTLGYDFLVIATGLELHYNGIEGMDTRRIGEKGLGSIYASAESAEKTWKAMSSFADRGGIGLFGRPVGEMKCAGAPLKYSFITDDILRRRGRRERSELVYMSHSNALFGVPIVAEKVRMLFEQRGIKVNDFHVLTGIDIDRQMARYNTPNGMQERHYDFINVVPPMRAPEVIRNSSLKWQQGPWALDGWVEVDPASLRHRRYSNVFAVGDIAGVPKGKTAASVKWQAPVVVDQILADIQGKESLLAYNGYTSCPLITKLGRAMLIEFDYKNNLVPSFPGVIAPLEELWVSWVMKTMALKPTYISMLRGMA